MPPGLFSRYVNVSSFYPSHTGVGSSGQVALQSPPTYSRHSSGERLRFTMLQARWRHDSKSTSQRITSPIRDRVRPD